MMSATCRSFPTYNPAGFSKMLNPATRFERAAGSSLVPYEFNLTEYEKKKLGNKGDKDAGRRASKLLT